MKITIKDLARELGLAVSTVSRALNGTYGVHPDTIERVRNKARELGYIPDLGAKQLVGKRSHLIGVFMPEFDFEATPEFDEFFPPMHKLLSMFGKNVIIFSVPHMDYQPNDLNKLVVMRNLEGCVFMPAFSKEHPILQDALKLKIPCVNFGGALGPSCSFVASDDREGGRQAGRYLLEQGHRMIGFIGGPKGLKISQERYTGFCEVLQEDGLDHDQELVVSGDFSGASGADGALLLVQRHPGITALFCANDLMAMGAIMAFEQAGMHVPQRISVVGYDGTFFSAYTNPPLTTIQHARQKLTQQAVEMLLELLHGGTGRRKIIAPTLVERASVTRLS